MFAIHWTKIFLFLEIKSSNMNRQYFVTGTRWAELSQAQESLTEMLNSDPKLSLAELE